MNDVSTLRLYLMRLLYLLNFLMLGMQVWPALLNHPSAWEPVRGVAFAFWAALSLLSGLGVRYPLKMVPALLMQFVYKSIWLLAVALPHWPEFASLELTKIMWGGVIVDVIVIPWMYVFANFVRARGDRWKRV